MVEYSVSCRRIQFTFPDELCHKVLKDFYLIYLLIYLWAKSPKKQSVGVCF